MFRGRSNVIWIMLVEFYSRNQWPEWSERFDIRLILKRREKTGKNRMNEILTRWSSYFFAMTNIEYFCQGEVFPTITPPNLDRSLLLFHRNPLMFLILFLNRLSSSWFMTSVSTIRKSDVFPNTVRRTFCFHLNSIEGDGLPELRKSVLFDDFLLLSIG
jgi:hypothetical protein